MRIEQKEIKSCKTVYVAEDGTEFDNQSECQQYDDSAEGVLRGRIKSFTSKQLTEENLFNIGSDDYEYVIVHPTSDTDIKDILQLMKLLKVGDINYNKAQEELAVSNDYLFGIGCKYDGYDTMYFYGSCENVLNNIRKNMGIDDEEDEQVCSLL